MWIGNLFLVVLNLPLIGIWVRLITVPYHLLYPSILVFCAIGVFSLNNSEFDVYLMALFGVLGYVLAQLGCEPAPMLLAFILGPLMEEYLRRAMLLSRGNPWVFVTAAHQRDLARARRAGDVRRAAPGVRPDAEGSVLGRTSRPAACLPHARAGARRPCRFAWPSTTFDAWPAPVDQAEVDQPRLVLERLDEGAERGAGGGVGGQPAASGPAPRADRPSRTRTGRPPSRRRRRRRPRGRSPGSAMPGLGLPGV